MKKEITKEFGMMLKTIQNKNNNYYKKKKISNKN